MGTRSTPTLLTTLSDIQQAPKWSFRGRAPDARESASKNPGPGQYAISHPYKTKYSRAPCAMFGTSSRDGPLGGFAPGPGQYNSKTMISDGTPKFGFGTSTRGELGKRSGTPGPGTYDVRKNLDGLQVSLSARFSNEGRRAKTPGPGTYNVKDNTLEASPQFGFGTSRRPSLGVTSKAPGPGTYAQETALGGNISFHSSPKYSMKPRRDLDSSKKNSTPGPGAHGGQFTTFGY